MALFGTLILAAVIIVFVYWWFSYLTKKEEFYDTIPSVPGLPFFGNALAFTSTVEFLNTLQRFTREHGETYKIKIGPFRKLIVTTDYKFLETVLGSTKIINKSDDYIYLHSWLGSGLLTSEGPKWKKHRRLLTPAFHFQILEQFLGVFESCGNILIKKLEGEVGKDSVDIYPLVTLCALDIICESTMGICVNAQMNKESQYVFSVKEMNRILMERTLSPIEMYDLPYRFTKNYAAERRALKILHTQTNNVINERKAELANKKNIDNKKDNEFSKTRKPFLDLLLEISVDGKPLTHEEIREEVDTFMFEGHDTTASAVSFTLFCLANHPEVQEKALEEQRSIFSDQKNPNVTYSDLQEMKYLELVIKESLRLYPSVPAFGRTTTKDVGFNNMPLPEGDTVIVFAFGMHRNPKYFKDPEKFNPGRFADIDGKLPYAYIPFSAGPRNCIGQKFAMLTMKSTVSKVLRNFELRPAIPKHNLVLASEVILKSATGIKISLHLRS